MGDLIQTDVHHSYVLALTARLDWAALVRYWVAHQYLPALDAAVDIATRAAPVEGGRWIVLAELLNDVRREPLSFERRLPEGFIESWSDFDTGLFRSFYLRPEQQALLILEIYPRLVLCEFAGGASPEDRQRLYEIGIDAAGGLGLMAQRSKDLALTAFGYIMMARALLELGRIDESREKYAEALAIYRDLATLRHEVYAPHVASTLNNLGNVCHELNDLEMAYAICTEALDLYRTLAQSSPGSFESGVAMTANSLGRVQGQLQDLEGARSSFQMAVLIRRTQVINEPHTYKHDLALALTNLGHAQRALNEGRAAAETLNESLVLLRELAVVNPYGYQPFIATTLDNLAIVHKDLNEAELAFTGFTEALAIQRVLAHSLPQVYEPHVAGTLNNLGTTHIRLNNLEKALECFEESLTIRRSLADKHAARFQPDVARTLINISSVYRVLRDLRRSSASCEEAIRIYRALALSHPDIYSGELATALNTYGNIRGALDEWGGAVESLEEAIAIRRRLMNVHPQVYGEKVAVSLSNLGAVKHRLGDYDAALICFTEALEVFVELATVNPSVYRPQLAGTMVNAGLSYKALGRFTQARDCYCEAIEILTSFAETHTSEWLLERQGAWFNLGCLYLEPGEHGQLPNRVLAVEALRNARDCAEAYRVRFTDIALRRRVQDEFLHVYERLVDVNAELWFSTNDVEALSDALETAEQSRARNLTEMLSDETLSPIGAPAALIEEFRRLRRRLRHERERLNHVMSDSVINDGEASNGSCLRGPGGFQFAEIPAADPDGEKSIEAAESIDELQSLYDHALDEIRTLHDPDFNPDLPISPISNGEARALVPTDIATAIVEYCLTGARGYAFIVTCNAVSMVVLPDLNATQAGTLGNEWYHSYYGNDRAAFEAEMLELLRPISELAIRPVVAALEGMGIRRVILVPHKALHVFPLHACTLADGTLVADCFEEIGYAPSLSILHRCAHRRRPLPQRLLLIENPTSDLPFTRVEGAGVCRLYPSKVRYQERGADRAAVLSATAGAHVFHFSGHSFFDFGNPLDSALILQDRRGKTGWLTLRDVFTDMNLGQTTLAVLNGCESGMVKPERVDEYFGLSAGFLLAGAACVVSSLWAVWDLSSALLLLRFHTIWRNGRRTPLAALSDAQRWLRTLSGFAIREEVLPWLLVMMETDEQRRLCTEAAEAYARSHMDAQPFSSPVHWAPFTASGLSFLSETARDENR